MLERIIKFCKKHGQYEHVIYSNGEVICRRCKNNTNNETRRRKKRKLVEIAGGKCIKCGYDRCVGVLEFHHKNPNTKDCAIGRTGLGFKKLLEEIKKCILLCANCHRELECGYITV